MTTPERRARHGAVSLLLGILGLLLFCWPWMRVPRLSVSQTYLHLFGAWAVLVAATFWLSRAAAPPEPEGPPREEEDV